MRLPPDGINRVQEKPRFFVYGFTLMACAHGCVLHGTNQQKAFRSVFDEQHQHRHAFVHRNARTTLGDRAVHTSVFSLVQTIYLNVGAFSHIQLAGLLYRSNKCSFLYVHTAVWCILCY